MLFSVITITKDNPDGFARTRESVKAQSFFDYEWIVVDGDIEPDDGIYDAMNKGISRAGGTFLIFLNAGDTFAAPDVLARLASFAAYDFLYGDAIEGGHMKPARHSIAYGMPTHHQAMAFRRGDLRYDTRYQVAADYKFTAQAMAQGRCKYAGFPICVFEQGGLSQRKTALARQEQILIRRELGIHAPFAPALQRLSLIMKKAAPALYWMARRRFKTSRA